MEITNERTLRDLEYAKLKEKIKECAASELGQKHIEKLKPTANLEAIKLELQRVEELREALLEADLTPINICDLRPILRRARQTTALPAEDFLPVLRTLESARRLKERIYKLERFKRLEEIADRIYVFRELEENIRRVIDEDGEIRDNASAKLRQLSARRRILEERVQKKLKQYLSSPVYAGAIQDAVITRRSSRLVIPIKSSLRQEFDCIVHDSSDSGQTLYVEPTSVVEDNNEIRELEGQIRDEKHRLLKELTAKLNAESKQIEKTLKALGLLDSIYARARYANLMRCNMPKLNADGHINLIAARHPLLEQAIVVPIDLSFGDQHQGVVITGPNTGGKTVTLKTLGLLTLMIQSGIPIPASPDSSMAVFEKIYSDIGEEQNIEQNLSTFSSHMSNIIEILNHVDEHSLVLIDELGAGTDPQEGAALGIALLKSLLASGAKMAVTTHFSPLKHFAYKHPNLKTCSMDFDVKTLMPTYKILEGVGASNAFIIAQRLGLSENVLRDAKGFLTAGELQAEEMIRELQRERQQISEARAELAAKLQKTEETKSLYERKLAELAKEKEEALSEELRALEALLKQARSQIEASLHAARRGSQEEQLREELKRLGALEEDLKRAEQAFEGKEQSLEPLALEELKDRKVLVAGIDKIGTVREIVSPERIEVDVNGVKVWARLKDLRRAPDEQFTSLQVGKSASYSVSMSSTPKMELVVRGLSASEAIREVDLYLDKLILSDIKRAYIIHGKGTGTLRREIRKHLAELPFVKRCYSPPANEGGDGVTVVELK